jgi:hypothetical protein
MHIMCIIEALNLDAISEMTKLCLLTIVCILHVICTAYYALSEISTPAL